MAAAHPVFVAARRTAASKAQIPAQIWMNGIGAQMPIEMYGLGP
jgi:hypothetical protein